ncbi:MAG: hypothetical protein A2030_01380 [Chloroflexi bacterium RBG_19FT_COMBO_50_10]|nr:MAG: hypothetical protein A2030_01380 [Chloroflexi bacterium RBG_19FT_COMBO_50_10]
MIIIRPTSLAATLDTSAEAFFYHNPIPAAQREEIASMIISRQSLSGMNAGFFIPFTAESETRVRLFSGEYLSTDFARAHIHLIEAIRILKLLCLDSHAVSQSILTADRRMEKMCYSKFCAKGECKALTVAYLRYLVLDSSGNVDESIKYFLTNLAGHRDGKGKWSGFPFYFILLMLSELDNPLATQELQYAVPACEKQQAHTLPADPIAKRRQAIIASALARR